MAAPVDRKELPLRLTSDEVRAIASPKLYLVAEEDGFGFKPDVEKMFEMSRAPKELVTFAGKAHGTDVFKTDEGEQVIDAIVEFLETQVELQ